MAYKTLFEKYSYDKMTDNTQFMRFVQCKDCKYKSDGTVWSNAYNKGYCAQYPRDKYPKGKPHGVYMNVEKCSKYEKE